MDYLEQSFNVHFDYRVYFTSGIFDASNKDFDFFLKERSQPSTLQKILFVIDEGVLNAHPESIYFLNAPPVHRLKHLLLYLKILWPYIVSDFHN